MSLGIIACCTAGDHLVCEFSCSCCKPTISAAADAVCTYLYSGPQSEVVAAFNRFGGPTAIEVALDSSNDIMVCAAVRVIGALLQVAVNSSRGSTRQSECHQQQQQQTDQQQQQQPDQQQQQQLDQQQWQQQEPDHQQQQQQQEASSFLQAGHPATTDQPDQRKLTHDLTLDMPWLDTLRDIQPGTGAQGNIRTTTTSPSSSSSNCDLWCRMLQEVIDRVAGGSYSAAVRVTALRELEQLLLQIVRLDDTAGPDHGVAAAEIGISSSSKASSSSCARADSSSTQEDLLGIIARSYQDSEDVVLESSATSSEGLCVLTSKQPVALVTGIDSRWLNAVMQSSMAALQDSNQEVRR